MWKSLFFAYLIVPLVELQSVVIQLRKSESVGKSSVFCLVDAHGAGTACQASEQVKSLLHSFCFEAHDAGYIVFVEVGKPFNRASAAEQVPADFYCFSLLSDSRHVQVVNIENRFKTVAAFELLNRALSGQQVVDEFVTCCPLQKESYGCELWQLSWSQVLIELEEQLLFLHTASSCIEEYPALCEFRKILYRATLIYNELCPLVEQWSAKTDNCVGSIYQHLQESKRGQIDALAKLIWRVSSLLFDLNLILQVSVRLSAPRTKIVFLGGGAHATRLCTFLAKIAYESKVVGDYRPLCAESLRLLCATDDQFDRYLFGFQGCG